jgi:hypothetical protein
VEGQLARLAETEDSSFILTWHVSNLKKIQTADFR